MEARISADWAYSYWGGVAAGFVVMLVAFVVLMAIARGVNALLGPVPRIPVTMDLTYEDGQDPNGLALEIGAAITQHVATAVGLTGISFGAIGEPATTVGNEPPFIGFHVVELLSKAEADPDRVIEQLGALALKQILDKIESKNVVAIEGGFRAHAWAERGGSYMHVLGRCRVIVGEAVT